MLAGMHRGVLYGVIAFGLVVSLAAFFYALAKGRALWPAAYVAALLAGGLVLYPLRDILLGRTPANLRGNTREALGVALLVFALLTAATGIIVGVVGREPWLSSAVALAALAGMVAAAGAWVLKRRKTGDTIRWHE
jgi:hypothetical protein